MILGQRLALYHVGAGAAAYLLAIAMAALVTGGSVLDPSIQVSGLVVSVVAALLATTWSGVRRVVPLWELQRWSLGAAQASWARVGVDPAMGPARVLESLADRSDEEAIGARCSVLSAMGRANALEAALAAWHPTDARGRAAFVRWQIALAALRGGDGDPAAAIEAAAAIPDAAERATAIALAWMEASDRALVGGRDPMPALLSARRALDASPLFRPGPPPGAWLSLAFSFVYAIGTPTMVVAGICFGDQALAVALVAVVAMFVLTVVRSRSAAGS